MTFDPPWAPYASGILIGLGAAIIGSSEDIHGAIWVGGFIAGISARALDRALRP